MSSFSTNKSPAPMGCYLNARGLVVNSSGEPFSQEQIDSLSDEAKKSLLATEGLHDRYRKMLAGGTVEKKAEPPKQKKVVEEQPPKKPHRGRPKKTE